MPFSGRSALLGIGRQTTEGTAVAPTICFATTGSLVSPGQSTEVVPVARGVLSPTVRAKTMHKVEGEIEMLATPKAIGYLLHSVMGGVTSGAGIHTFVFGDTQNFHTIHSRLGTGNDDFRCVDSAVSELEFTWEAGKELKVKASIKGKVGEKTSGVTFTPVETEDFHLRYTGATMKVDLATTPATTQVRNIKKGSIKIIRNLELILTDELSARFVQPQERNIEVSWTETFENSNTMRNAWFGGITGTGLASAGALYPVYGSLDFLFTRDATESKLQFQAPRMNFDVQAFPKAKPNGEHLELEVVGAAVLPTSGEMFTSILTNTHTSYSS